MAETYKIVRYFWDEEVGPKIIETGLTLEEAQAHCRDPETSSSTAKGTDGVARTKKYGKWFGGYTVESH